MVGIPRPSGLAEAAPTITRIALSAHPSNLPLRHIRKLLNVYENDAAEVSFSRRLVLALMTVGAHQEVVVLKEGRREASDPREALTLCAQTALAPGELKVVRAFC